MMFQNINVAHATMYLLCDNERRSYTSLMQNILNKKKYFMQRARDATQKKKYF